MRILLTLTVIFCTTVSASLYENVCNQTTPGDPLSTVNWYGVASAITGVIIDATGIPVLGSILGVIDAIHDVWQSERDYSKEVSDCIQLMINNAINEELRSEAQQALSDISTDIKDLKDELTSNSDPSIIMDNAREYYGRIFQSRSKWNNLFINTDVTNVTL